MSLVYFLGEMLIKKVKKAISNEPISSGELRGGFQGLDLVGNQNGVPEPEDACNYISDTVSPVVGFINNLLS